jgi:integrase/recombinase XerC
LRLRAILSLLALQGLRQIEVVRLNVEDYDSNSGLLFVQGKGSDDKEPVVLNPQCVLQINMYINSLGIKSGPLFYSFSNYCNHHRLSTKSVRNIIDECLQKLDITNSTHGFRHFFVTKLIKSYRGNIVEVAEFSRHKSLDMLQVYNDNIRRDENKPKFYETFSGINM